MKTLVNILADMYEGQWSSFPCPTDTLEDYDKIAWKTDSPPSLENLRALGVFPTPADLKAAEPMRLLRSQRNQKLVETDWWAVQDRVMSNEQQIYRQQLRDLPETVNPAFDESGQLSGMTFPEIPE